MKVQAKNKFKTAKSSILGVVVGAIAITGIIGISNASSLGYQTEIGLGFTFNPSITVSISGDLSINELTPGNYADSNIVTIGVVTNAVNGYVLQATTGTNSTNNRLVNTENSNYYFTSLGTNETVTSMNSANDNTWGYSYSTDNGTTWISSPGTLGYSGLPQDANTTAAERGSGGKTLIDTNDSASNQSVKFKIGAKAASNQASGEYTNTVNFYAVTYPEPEPSLCTSNQYIMQNISQWGSSVTAGNEVTACDNRDGKTYTVARLADGNIWMTQNLDFDIVNGGAAINSTNTDVPSNWADAGNLANTHATSDTTWTTGTTGNTTPQSYDPGDLCWDGTITSSGSVLTTCTDRHYHIGNYYDWTAAVAMANSSSYDTDDTDVDQSICPAGWTLPKSGSNNSSGSFAYLVDEASLTSDTTGNIHTSPYYFVYGGTWDGNSYYIGGRGYYWSPTVFDGGYAYDLYFARHSTLVPDAPSERYVGFSVRCVVR